MGVLIKDIVDGMFETYETTDPFELCSNLGIKIIKSSLGKEIKGFFQRTETGYEIIHINSEIPEEEMKYICAHELGHAIMHTDMAISFFVDNSLQIKNKFELQADKFAAELLLYDIEYDSYSIKELNIDQLSSYYNVPKELIKYRFNRR